MAWCLFLFNDFTCSILFLYSIIHLITLVNGLYSVSSPQCHEEERFALLQFNQSLSLSHSASYDPSAYPKTTSWKHNDCCSWDGVKCDEDTDHVISLDLSSSFLFGSIHSNSTLFSLVHLRTLNLAGNDFNHSPIPPVISHLSTLSTLNLTNSVFSGQIPTQILKLSKLTSLDLSYNHLYGEFPTGIFHLPYMVILDVRYNQNLCGHLPEFNQSSSFKALSFGSTNFSGNLPFSIGNLKALNELDLYNCSFSGSLPASLGNLTQLTHLHLSDNKFTVTGKFSWLGKLVKLTALDLNGLNLHGEIPSLLANLTQLETSGLRSNQFVGKIPSWMMNMTRLTVLDLGENQVRGTISSSFSQLNNLVSLDLSFNNLGGEVEADIFLSLKKLIFLSLSFNKISFLTRNRLNSSLPKFECLQLSKCNLVEFPSFLQFQNKLEILFLSENKIHGIIPKWIWNTSETLDSIFLDNNFLTGFEGNPTLLPADGLGVLCIDNNVMQGNLPVPPSKMIEYDFANNRLTGEIPPMICHATSLSLLDLSNNSMNGEIPQCLGNFSNSLTTLNLNGNNFSGILPQSYSKDCNLKEMYLNQNQFEGKLPRSLQNCKMLELLDIANNQMQDIFPFWLGVLPHLHVLIMRSNKFHGAIGSPLHSSEFPVLRIIDLSANSFEGALPAKYMEIWSGMKRSHVEMLTYMQNNISIQIQHFSWSFRVDDYITITIKGVKREYLKILNIFSAVDLSSNKFKGEIPEAVGSLKGLQSLNLSNNHLSGPIPPSLGNLTQLESLDLSQNNLSGGIPLQLPQQLNFLEFLNVSHNHLTGPIPHGGQFNTFDNTSYLGNSALCGQPLAKNCGTVRSTDSTSASDDDWFPSGVDWTVIFAGFGGGLLVGLIVGKGFTNRHHDWFMEKFGGAGHWTRRRP